MPGDNENGTTLQLYTGSGKIIGRRWGSPNGRLALCIPGLLQYEACYQRLGERLGSASLQAVAISLRGRGRSEATLPGTYGVEAHTRDVAEIATQLSDQPFDLIGWSFGAAVAMTFAASSPERVRKLVLIDAVGRPDPSTVPPIMANVMRYGRLFADPDEYVNEMVATGLLEGCADDRRDYYAAELMQVEGGYKLVTSRDALLEDIKDVIDSDKGYELWRLLSMPVLLLRATRPLLPGLGYIVTEEDRDRFLQEVQTGRVVEITANHYCIAVVHETLDAIERFLNE